MLLAFAVISAGPGHGSYLPLAVFAAPFSYLTPTAALLGLPIMWSVYGVLATRSTRIFGVLFLTIHIVGVGLVLLFGSGIESAQEQWSYLREAARVGPGTLIGGFVVYILGQMIAWRMALMKRSN